jgi:hypothetical protein
MSYAKQAQCANDFAPAPLFKIFYRADKYFAKADSINIFSEKDNRETGRLRDFAPDIRVNHEYRRIPALHVPVANRHFQ